ncbi:MAG: glycosyltransferase family 4 protein [Alphaproteobacteria bacterium]|nr:glycosyltransferase family 4 protein [Alphaproteobacteria bacterium]
MKILFAVKTLDGSKGGAEKVLADISSGLAEKGHNVSILSFDRPHGRSFYNFSDKVRRIRLGVGNVLRKATFWEVITRMRVIRKVVTRHNPDVVIAFMHSSYIPCAFALIGTGVPVIASEHTVPRHYKGRIWEFALLILSRFFVKKITVLSESVKKEYPSILHKKMVVMHNPVKEANHPADPIASSKLPKLLLNVGRLVPSKRQDVLIRSFARIANDHPEWNLRIVGEDYYRPQLEYVVEEEGMEGRIELPGATRDIYEEYENAQIFVQPSRYESFGLATAEAMAHGLPAIGFADCPGTNEVIEDGKNGILVKTDNGKSREESLAEAIKNLISDAELRTQLGQKGPETIEPFSPQRVVDEWETLVENVSNT